MQSAMEDGLGGLALDGVRLRPLLNTQPHPPIHPSIPPHPPRTLVASMCLCLCPCCLYTYLCVCLPAYVCLAGAARAAGFEK